MCAMQKFAAIFTVSENAIAKLCLSISVSIFVLTFVSHVGTCSNFVFVSLTSNKFWTRDPLIHPHKCGVREKGSLNSYRRKKNRVEANMFSFFSRKFAIQKTSTGSLSAVPCSKRWTQLFQYVPVCLLNLWMRSCGSCGGPNECCKQTSSFCM